MARHLSNRDREAIIDMIDGWSPENMLTWQRLIDRIGDRLGIHPTRQTLDRHADIKLAYQCRRNDAPRVQPSPSERILRQQVERLTAENSRLSEQLNFLRQEFLQWQYSLYKEGTTEDMLKKSKKMRSEPLPRIDRDRSD